MFQKTLVTFIITVFTLLVLVGLNFHTPYGLHSRATVCPLMKHTISVCPMDTSEHITAWQGLFTAVPQSEAYLFIALAILFIAYAFYGFIFLNEFLEERYRRYKYNHPDSSLYGYFKRVFSRGILQPKLYA